MSAKITIEHDWNGTNHTLMVNQQPVLELPTDSTGAADDLTNSINDFIDDESIDGDYVEVKSDDEKLGIIVDVWNKEQTDCVATQCFWFDDWIVNYIR